MAEPSPSVQFSFDEGNLDDAELWAVIDSAAASNSRPPCKPLLPPHSGFPSSPTIPVPSRTPTGIPISPDGKVVQEERCGDHRRPHMMARFVEPGSGVGARRMVVVRRPPQGPTVTLPVDQGGAQQNSWMGECGEGDGRHSLFGRFPSVSLFKRCQNAAMEVLEKSDYTLIGGNPFIKKSGWRKISFFFNLSFEIKDKTIEYDENRNVLRAEFIVRAIMQGGRFADGWGSCERREKRFMKPNHDIPSTAETRAKTKACQDLLGIGEYRPGIGNNMVR